MNSGHDTVIKTPFLLFLTSGAQYQVLRNDSKLPRINLSNPIPPTMSGRNNNNSQGSIKLRDSCELCAAAKVKCNKDKPACSRCWNRGLRCEYGASRRNGRPAQNTQSHTQNRTNYDHGNRLSEAVTALPDSVGPKEWLTCMINTPLEDDSMDDLTRNPSDSSLTDMSSQYMLNHGQSLPISLDSDFEMDSNVTGGSDGLQPEWNGTHCDPGSCCMSIALDLLRRSSITDTSKTCPRRRNQVMDLPPPSLETVVSTNMYNIESVSILLDCSCALNGNLLHTIWLIILNIITWYARAASGAASGTARPVSSNGRESAASMAPFPFKDLLGSPPTGQAQAAAQTFLDELYRIQDIVNRFAQRIEAARLQDESSKFSSTCRQTGIGERSDIQAAMSNTPWFLSQASSSQVEADLRRRLRAVALEVVQILVRC